MTPTLRQITPLTTEFSWNKEISDGLLQYILFIKKGLLEDFKKEIKEVRLGFKTLSISLHRPLEKAEIQSWLESKALSAAPTPLPDRILEIPVCYSGETGRDLQSLAKTLALSVDELISLHSAPLYRIHFFGFLPGFMYLRGLPEVLNIPRKRVPDRTVPAGSVAIGGNQTGIYPMESPGGWHLIGRSPILFFNQKEKYPVMAEIGERINFRPITLQEYERNLRHPFQKFNK